MFITFFETFIPFHLFSRGFLRWCWKIKQNMHPKETTFSCKDIFVMIIYCYKPTECPFSWVKRPGHSSCYKFAFTKKTPLAASQYCALHHAHLVTFEEPEELDYLLGLLDDVGSFPTLTAYSFWIVGMKHMTAYMA